MAIPQLRSEGIDAGGTASTTTPTFSTFTWQANDIIEIVVATDGTIPTLQTANGFALAQDPNGNSASVSTNAGAAGAAECAVVIFWKRATGSTTTTDPPPVIAMNGATSWCLEPNSYSGCRTSGTPYHQIVTATLTSASTSASSPGLTSTLANCLFLGLVASAEDDSAFNNWTMSGASGPAAGAPTYGWHNGSGNRCSFTGCDGGYATAGGPRTGSVTLSVSSKQAKIGRILASLAEPAGITGNESRTLDSSIAASAGGVSLTGNSSSADSGSTAASAGGVSVTGTESAAAGPSSSASTGTTITSTGNESATGGASAAASSGTVTGGPTGNESRQLAGSSGAAAGAVTVTGSEARALDGSTATSAAGVAVTGTESSADSASSAAATGSVFTPSTLAIGKFGIRQKSNTTSPTSGTITTYAPYPAWQPSHLYNLSDGVRVTNGGNEYELTFPSPTESGTSAASGGPTGTGSNIVDGGCRWNFLGPGTGAVDTQATGSFFVASVAWGRVATGGAAPTDSKGNTYSLITKQNYIGFPSSAQATYSAGVGSGGAAHTLTAAFGAGNDGGGDECTAILGEIIGGLQLKDHSYVENSPVSNVVTSAPVTVTGPAVLVAFWWLNGTVRTEGTNHVATPGSGFTAIPEATALMEIGPGGAGEVQVATHYRVVASAGTYTASITTTLGEGAAVHLLAIQGQAGINGTESAASSSSAASSAGTVTTPRTGTEVGALSPSTGAAAGVVSLTGGGSGANDASRAAAAGVVAVTGAGAAALGGSTAASAGTLIPVITGTGIATAGASTSASFGQVISGHAADVAAVLAGSLVAAAGAVVASGGAVVQASASAPAAAGGIAVAGAAGPAGGDSTAAARGSVGLPGGVTPRLAGILSTRGQLTGTLQLQGVTVAVIEGPITVFQGDTAQYLLIVNDDEGQPFPLSTATAIDVRVATAEGASVSIALGLGAGVQLLDESTSKGRAVIAFSSFDTSIAPTRYKMNVAVTAPGLRQHVIAPRDFVIAAVV